ncbi:hypothetical protein ACQP1O_19135 [Nocardia sp. CA-151230]|uniref:hypothetical protein n=1 Tax=Nocardia sp. CA-151230 TaxID=3239982 RepID=UPI003D8AA42D
MSALTQDTLRPVRVARTPEEKAERRRQAEKLLGRPLPPHPAQASTAPGDH